MVWGLQNSGFNGHQGGSTQRQGASTLGTTGSGQRVQGQQVSMRMEASSVPDECTGLNTEGQPSCPKVSYVGPNQDVSGPDVLQCTDRVESRDQHNLKTTI